MSDPSTDEFVHPAVTAAKEAAAEIIGMHSHMTRYTGPAEGLAAIIERAFQPLCDQLRAEWERAEHFKTRYAQAVREMDTANAAMLAFRPRLDAAKLMADALGPWEQIPEWTPEDAIIGMQQAITALAAYREALKTPLRAT